MELNITEFKERLNNLIAKNLPEADIAAYIHKEIRLAETMKASIMEEIDDETKDFLYDTAVQVNDYIFQLQQLELDLRLQYLTLDQRVAINDTEMRDRINDEMEKLHEMDPEKTLKEIRNQSPENETEK